MPLPAPAGNETRSAFLNRCMSDTQTNKDFKDNSQRYAVCNSLWGHTSVQKSPSVPYLIRLVKELSQHLPLWATKDAIQKARSHAGGSAYPLQSGAVIEKIALTDLSPKALADLSDAELISLHKRTHQLYALGDGKVSRETVLKAHTLLAEQLQAREHDHGGPSELDSKSEILEVEKRQLFSSMGGKKALANRLISLFPEHTTYVEPFCLPAGTPVHGNPSWLAVDEIATGKRILTSDGYHEVSQAFRHQFTGQMVDVRVRGDSRSFTLTANHPVLAVQRPQTGKQKLTLQKGRLLAGQAKWIKPDSLKPGDYLVRHFDASHINRGSFTIKTARRSKKVPVSHEVCRLIGLYLAEGNLDGSRAVGFTLHQKETEYIEFIIRVMYQVFETKPDIQRRANNQALYIRFSSVIAVKFFEQFGRGARNKHFSDWAKTLPLERQGELLRGVFEGDGSIGRDGLVLTVASERLADDVIEALYRRGLFPTRSEINQISRLPDGRMFEGRYWKVALYSVRDFSFKIQRTNWQGHHQLGRNLWGCGVNGIPVLLRVIDSIEIREVSNLPVYNLAVTGPESYVTPWATVHNCGGAAVYFMKQPSEHEVLSDMSEDVIYAYRAVQKLSDDDIAALAKRDWVVKRETFNALRTQDRARPNPDTDRLYRFLYLRHAVFGSGDPSKAVDVNAIGSTLTIINDLPAIRDRLKSTVILHADAVKVIRKYDSPETFFYLDPPYPEGTALRKDYAYAPYSVQQLDTLFSMLKTIKGKFLLSMSDPLASHVPKDFITRLIGTPVMDGPKRTMRREMLVSNYEPFARYKKSQPDARDVHVDGLLSRIKRRTGILAKCETEQHFNALSDSQKIQAYYEAVEAGVIPD